MTVLYTSYTAVRNAFASDYWEDATDKLTIDEYLFTSSVFTDEQAFIENFITRAADFIDGYVGGGPFLTTGALETCCRWLATYEMEQYLLAASSDRVVSVSINEDKNRAMDMLNKMLSGDITVTPDEDNGGTGIGGTLELVEPDNDGVTLTLGALEEDILIVGTDDAEEIPE